MNGGYKDFIDWFYTETAGMGFELKSALRMVADLEHKHGSGVVDDDRYIAGMAGCSVRLWQKLRKGLVDLGYISTTSGRLFLTRAWPELGPSLARAWPELGPSLAQPRKTFKENATSSENNGLDENGAQSEILKGTSIVREVSKNRRLSKQKDTYGPLSQNGGSEPAEKDLASAAILAFNGAAGRCGWPAVQRLSDTRLKHLMARLKDGNWNDALDKAEASDFLTGRSGNWRGFSFDWMCKQANYTKIMEGNYDNRNAADDYTSRAILAAAGAFQA